MSFVQEFREFALKGNVLDMAVGIIVGGAFNSVVGSMVKDLFSPVIGVLIGGVSFKHLAIELRAPINGKDGVYFGYGAFIEQVVQFLIVAFSVFLLVKGINTLRRKQEAAPPVSPTPTAQEKLLGEIRDLLKAKGA